jgi:hypothetical protein
MFFDKPKTKHAFSQTHYEYEASYKIKNPEPTIN